MNTHTIELTGYCAKAPDWPALYLGTAGSYGNEELAVTLGEGWQGLTVSATFQPAGVTVLVSGDGTLDVPWEATETALDAAKGRIVFEGVTDGRVLISADIPYAVGSHSDTEGSNSQPPTPSQWEQFVNEVKGDADRAEQAAKNAEATLQDVKDAGTQAVTDIGNAKDSALEAIAAAREEAAGSISADVEGAKQAAADAEKSAADAEQSAKNAADVLANVQSAGQSALDDIATERQNTLSDIQNEGAKQQSAVAGAGTAALEAIGQTEQAAINQVRQAGATQASAVQSAGTTQISQINSAGAAQVQAVKDEGAAQTSALDDAAAAHKTELDSIASHPPRPNTETGKWQVWNAEAGAYQDTDALYQGGYYTASVSDDGVLTWQGSQPEMPAIPSVNIKGPKGDKGDPGLGVPSPTQSDAGKVPTVKADGSAYDLAGPYAPLSAAIRPTASGNPVSITDSVEWPLLGLKVYGKSTQVTTTGAQLFHAFAEFTSMISNGLTVTKISDSVFILNGTVQDENASVWIASFTLTPGTYSIRANGRNVEPFLRLRYFGSVSSDVTDYDKTIEVQVEQEFRFYIQAGVGYIANNYRFEIMLNAGSAVKPWEPYTDGQATPNPNYPQDIVSAGDGGSIAMTVSDGADQSQSLTVSTPNGLPGISVASGGNYTDASGQRRWADIIDYSNEKKYQYVNEVVVDGTNVKFTANADGSLWNLPTYSAPNALQITRVQINKYFPSNVFIINGSYDFIFTQSQYMTPYFETIEELNAFCVQKNTEGNPLTIMYVMDTPIETPLSEDEITAYKALHTYDGATVVSTAEDVAGIEARYVADAQKYIDNRLTAAEQHIQELAAAQLNAQTGG